MSLRKLNSQKNNILTNLISFCPPKISILNYSGKSRTTKPLLYLKVDDANKELPYTDPPNYSLDSIVISRQDGEDVLLHLNVTKASGPDLISPNTFERGN